MKNIKHLLLIPFIALSLSACKTMEEGVLVRNRILVGKNQSVTPIQKKRFATKTSVIQTDSMCFIVEGVPDIEPGTLCYVRLVRDRHPTTQRYLEWNDMDEEDAKKYKLCGYKRNY